MLSRIARSFGIRTRRQYRLFLRWVAIVCVTFSGYAIVLLVADTKLWWSALPFAVLVIFTIFEFVLADGVVEHSYPVETEAILNLLERNLGTRAVESISDKLQRIILGFKACDQTCISGAVHIVVELNSSLEGRIRFGLLQLTEYAGLLGGSKGRITTLDQGIIGRCVRTGRIEHVNFADEVEYRNRMAEEFGFSKQEADAHTKTARSYLAVPLINDSRPIGVLYFFSTEPQVFPIAARDSNLEAQAKDVLDVLKTASIVKTMWV